MDNILQLFADHSRKIATIVSVLLIVLMSLSVANTVLVIMEAMAPPGVVIDTQPATTGAAGQPAFKVSNLELFGKMDAADAVAKVIDAPETSLNLELQGIFIADDEKQSTAIIAEKNRDGELFRIGDLVPGNATLAAVHGDHVLIKRGTRIEKLLYSDTAFRFVNDQPSEEDAAPTPDLSNEGISDANRSNLERIRDRIRNRHESSSAEPDILEPGSKLNEYREKLMNDFEGTLSEAGITAISTGESDGYQIGAEAEGMITQAGLQPGDVILSVNGRPVGSAANDSALMDQVMASSRVRVEVQRGTRRFFLTVPVPK